jgi:hypothetical protein
MSRARRIYLPRGAKVKAGGDGTPLAFEGMAVEAIREDWVIEDRWWTSRPLHRHYFELILTDGRALTVFRDVRSGNWHRQAA